MKQILVICLRLGFVHDAPLKAFTLSHCVTFLFN